MKKIIAIVLAVIILASVGSYAIGSIDFSDKTKTLRLVVPDNWEMLIGDSRSIDCAAANTSNFVKWSAEPEGIAAIDEFGRVTALKEGTATITAQNGEGYTDSVELKVVKESTKTTAFTENSGKPAISKVDYQGEAVKENDVLQKVVARYEKGSDAIPGKVADEKNYADAKTVTTKDGAKWEITAYGVLRTDENATNERDKYQRFMGDRYFYSQDTGDGKVLAIFADGKNGIWTVMKEGYTHIQMLEISGTDKAAMMSDTTQQFVARRGMVSEAYFMDGKWVGSESDNDGLWTSMYGGGELMRYAVLREDPNATPEEIEEARITATRSVEAVVLLTYISMRQGEVESFVRAQRSGSVTNPEKGKYYTDEALVKGGNFGQSVPFESPATKFDKMKVKYLFSGVRSYLQKDDNLSLEDPSSWVNTAQDSDTEYAKRERLLTGFWARTYSFKEEKALYGDYDGYAYWDMNGDGTATGASSMTYSNGEDFLLHNENIRGLKIDATREIPQRLWDNLIGSEYDISDIVYKGDTSSDEIIGHLFLYKLAYDILGPEDPELAQILQVTMESFAQHLVDNSYCLVDGTGQPTTWGKFSRTYLHNGQVLGGAALQSMVCLCAFKVAAYITGNQKWEDEYRMAALDEQYQYAEIMNQEWERYEIAILEYVNSVTSVLGYILRPIVGTETFKTLYRMILNYSDEEMAMLGYYLLFQLEDDEQLLEYYRGGVDDWWYSMSFSENPLWYYVYQLAYPEKDVTDQYGNRLVDTAAWSLSRHPIDTRKYFATNANRDDIAELDLDDLGIEGTGELSFSLDGKIPMGWDSDNTIVKMAGIVFALNELDWAVAAPDERALHKYNGSSYQIDNHHNPFEMEGSTTYTLPYWMGRYHGMLAE